MKIQTGATIDILVENCGRVNFGSKLNSERKGILGGVYSNSKELKEWTIYPLEFDKVYVDRYCII